MEPWTFIALLFVLLVLRLLAEALLQPVVTILCWVCISSVYFVIVFLECLFLLCFRGYASARTRWVLRVRELRKSFLPESEATRTGPRKLTRFEQTCLGSFVLLMVVGCFAVAGYVIWNGFSKERIRQVTARAEWLASRFKQQLESPDKVPPQPGLLAERDHWGEPFELIVQQGGLLTKARVAVRSSGPDQARGSGDDIVVTQEFIAPRKPLFTDNDAQVAESSDESAAKQQAGGLLKRAGTALAKRGVEALLKRGKRPVTEPQSQPSQSTEAEQGPSE